MSEVFAQTRWSLTDLLEAPSGPPLEQALAEIEQRTAAFETARAKLVPDISEQEFFGLVREYEELANVLSRVGAYAELWFTEDTQNQAALSFKARMEKLGAEVGNRTLFFSLWWKMLDDANAERLMKNAGTFHYWLEAQRRFRPHILSEAEEKIVNIKDVSGIGGLITVYDMITNNFLFELTVNGETKKMTYGELSNYFRHADGGVRQAAYDELFRVYGQNGPVLAQVYSNRVNDWKAEQVELRHFGTPIAARNLANDVPDAATDTLLEVCRENASLFQDYFKLKARWLGISPLRRYDIYAPLGQTDRTFPFPEAVELVLDSFGKFSPQVAQFARNVFVHNHIDSEVRPGKRGGAFCSSVLPSLTPWVLINYNQKPKDVSTLAHELGHSVHSQLAREHPLFTFQPGLPMAETASVFAEMILNERLLNEEKEPLVRRDILARLLDDAYATVMRQAFFVLFEKQAHIAIDEGRTLDEVNAMYLANLREQFGGEIEIPDNFKWEWIVIPHIFHTPFYTYAYSFGQLLTLSLYRRYKEEGEAFVPKFLKILSYGGSESPAVVLGEAGIDIASAAFWRGGFDVLRGFLAQLEELEAVPA